MSIKCDSCNELLDEDDGHARISIFDPAPDFSAAVIPPPRRPPQLDLCATCLVRAIEVLGLPKDAFVPRPAPVVPVASPSPTGALTPDDLVALGLTDGER